MDCPVHLLQPSCHLILHARTSAKLDSATRLAVQYPLQIPKHERTVEFEQELQELLDMVGIGYLVKRWAGDAGAL